MITGFGRTGTMFGCEHTDTEPDIMTIGKGFGCGFPVTGLISTDEITASLPFAKPSSSSSSYGGNPLGATAALTTIETIIDEDLVDNAERVGAVLLHELRALQEKYEFIGDVRGAGLLIGLDLVKDRTTKEPLSPAVTEQIFLGALRRGLLLMGYFSRVRINPPLILTETEARDGVAILDEVFAEVARGGQLSSMTAPRARRHHRLRQRRRQRAPAGVARASRLPHRRGRATPIRSGARWPQRCCPGVRAYADAAELLRQERLDFVDIAAPPALHAPLMIAAADAGVHVLCEKPLTTSLPDYRAVRAAVRRAGVVLHTVHNWKYSEAFQAVQRLLADGALGALTRSAFDTARNGCAAASGEQLARAGGDGRRRHSRRPRLARLLPDAGACQRGAAADPRRARAAPLPGRRGRGHRIVHRRLPVVDR